MKLGKKKKQIFPKKIPVDPKKVELPAIVTMPIEVEPINVPEPVPLVQPTVPREDR